MANKVQGICRRVRPKNEDWHLRIRGQGILTFPTKTKRERMILSAIRKVLISFGYDEIVLTNREKYIKNVNVSQEQLMKMKANNKFKEMEVTK